jgi:hypothetical protein
MPSGEVSSAEPFSLLHLGELDDAFALLAGEVTPAEPLHDFLVGSPDMDQGRSGKLGLDLPDGRLGISAENRQEVAQGRVRFRRRRGRSGGQGSCASLRISSRSSGDNR